MTSTSDFMTDPVTVDYLRAGAAHFRLPTLSVRFIERDGGVTGVDLPPTKSPSGAIYKLGSISKLVSALTTLLLAEEGALDLDDLVTQHLPWLPWPKSLDGVFCPTIRDLLLHTAGLPRGVFLNGTPTRDQVRRLIEPTTIATSPQQTKYSNLGYVLLGFVLEVVGADPYERLVAKRIFEPLGLRSAGFASPPGDSPFAPPHQLTCFLEGNRSPFEHAPMQLIHGPPAAMGLHATTDDLARLIASLVRSRSTMAAQPIPVRSVVRLFSERAGIGRGGGMGLRFARGSLGTLAFAGVEDFGHSAAVVIALDHGIAAVTATNRASAGTDLTRMLNALVRRRLLGRDAPPLSHTPVASKLAVGRYYGEGGTTFTMDGNDEGVSGALGTEPPSPIVAHGNNGLLILGGSLGKYLLRLERRSAICAGPHRFSRERRDARTVGRRRHAPYTGIYQSTEVGRVAVYERDQRLFFAHSPLNETLLESVDDGAFVYRGGPFGGEAIHFDVSNGSMRACGHVFRKTNEEY